MSDYYLPASSGEKEMGYMNQEGHVFLQASIFQPYLHIQNIIKRKYLTVFSTALLDFPGGSVVKNPPANAGLSARNDLETTTTKVTNVNMI